MRRHFSSISSILLGVSILCLNFAFTHAAVENEPSTENITTQAITTNPACLSATLYYCGEKYNMNPNLYWKDEYENCFCCQGQHKIWTMYSNSRYETCAPCDIGRYMDAIQHKNSPCHMCQSGKFQNSVRQSTCISCAAGKFSLEGAFVCQSCPAGKYNPDTGK